jgi:hypothetical protein
MVCVAEQFRFVPIATQHTIAGQSEYGAHGSLIISALANPLPANNTNLTDLTIGVGSTQSSASFQLPHQVALLIHEKTLVALVAFHTRVGISAVPAKQRS